MSGAARLPVDHVGVLGGSITELVSAWRRLGFRVVGPEELQGVDAEGRVSGLGQFSAHVMFEHDYVELTAVERPTPGHHLEHLLDRPCGLRLVILGSEEIEASRRACAAAGLAPGTVQSAAREIRYGSNGTARFRWFALPSADWPEALVAFVQHETREAVFQPEVCRHANGALGLSRILYRGDRLPARFPRLATEGAGTLLEAREPAVLATWFGAEVAGCPPLAALGVAVADVDETAGLLARAGIAYRETPEGLAVSPSLAGGAGVLFESA